MSVKEISKTSYQCKCEALSRKGVACGFEWTSDTIPKRCRKCLRRNWNVPPKLISFNGKSQSLTNWAHDLGLSVPTIRARIKAGWPIGDCLDPQHFQPGRKPKEESR